MAYQLPINFRLVEISGTIEKAIKEFSIREEAEKLKFRLENIDKFNGEKIEYQIKEI